MCQIESPSDSEQTVSGFWHYLNHASYQIINNVAKFISLDKSIRKHHWYSFLYLDILFVHCENDLRRL